MDLWIIIWIILHIWIIMVGSTLCFVQVNKVAKHVLHDSHKCQFSVCFVQASIVLPFNFFLSFSLLTLLG